MPNQLRPQFERDLNDSMLFMKEVLIVAWRFNPASIAAYTCGQLFEALTDATPPQEKAAMVTEVLNSIEIPPVEQFEDDFCDGISEICEGVTSEAIKGAIAEYPQLEDFLTSRIGDEPNHNSSFRRMTSKALGEHRAHYHKLHAYFSQLADYLPRYSTIMKRSGMLDGIIGFAAGFFGGYVGAAGAEAWGNWRDSGDQEFCQKFGNAFDQFANECYRYTNHGEIAMSLIFDRLIDEMRRIDHRLFDCYDELADAGWDIAPLYIRYRMLDEELDVDSRELFSIAVNNLEENRSIHFRTIENIRQMMGLD